MISHKSVILVILISAITAVEAFGQYLLKIYYNSKHGSFKRTDQLKFLPLYILPYITWMCYGLCTFMLSKRYAYTSMGRAELYWDSLSTIIVPLLGTIIFKEHLGYQGWSGIFLVILGSFIVSSTNSK